jgi:hypothetical protein
MSAPPLTRGEKATLLAMLAMLLAWTLMPVIRQPAEYHAFADQRSLLGIPNAADVLSNIAFVAVGLLGLSRLHGRARPAFPVPQASLDVFFFGLLLTGLGSVYYHLHPTDATLVWDRLPLTIALAGVYGAVFTTRVSRRAGLAILLAMLVLGPASVLFWAASGDLSLYVLVQGGLMAALLALLFLTPKGDDPFPWWALVLWYAIAKVVEFADASIWQATGGLLGGHAIKHLAAALGALVIANALRPRHAAPA